MKEPPKGSTRSGRWERHPGPEPYRRFLTAPLPLKPPLDLSERLLIAQDRATKALARLDGMAALLPDPGPILHAYVRKEAVLSSQIEGTQSSLSDLLLYENKQAAGRVQDFAELDRRHPAGQRGLRAAAPARGPSRDGRAREVHPRRARADGDAHQDRSRPRRGSAGLPSSVPQPLFQAAPHRVLRGAHERQAARRLGGVAGLLPGRRRGCGQGVVGNRGSGREDLRRRPPQAGGAGQSLGIVQEISGKRRKQVFSYHAYWKLISKGMEGAE